jgi:GT2 family glycosyltransferase
MNKTAAAKGCAVRTPRIGVIVLTWNSHAYTAECLRSLAAQTTPHDVYVVDNASTDGSAQAIAREFPRVHLIVNAENMGFAGGNNVGLAAAFAEGADAALVLNSDTRLEPDTLEHLTEAVTTHPEAGIFCPLILFAAPPHDVWFAGATIRPWRGSSVHTPYGAARETIPPGIRPIARGTGSAMLISRACYERIGGFDAPLFMYFEDVDYSLRARRQGFVVLLVTRAVVYHHVSISSGGPKSPTAMYYMARNATVVMDGHYPLPTPLRWLRHVIIALILLAYLVRPPQALSQMRDVIAGCRDARRGRLGPRANTPATGDQ